MITIHEFRFDHDLNTSSLDRLEEDLERRLGYSLKWDKEVPPTEPRKGFYLTYERGGISFNDHGVDGVTLNYYDGQSSKAYLRIRRSILAFLVSRRIIPGLLASRTLFPNC